jgi:hypothetical protein
MFELIDPLLRWANGSAESELAQLLERDAGAPRIRAIARRLAGAFELLLNAPALDEALLVHCAREFADSISVLEQEIRRIGFFEKHPYEPSAVIRTDADSLLDFLQDEGTADAVHWILQTFDRFIGLAGEIPNAAMEVVQDVVFDTVSDHTSETFRVVSAMTAFLAALGAVGRAPLRTRAIELVDRSYNALSALCAELPAGLVESLPPPARGVRALRAARALRRALEPDDLAVLEAGRIRAFR